jgi:hypothetical protein
MSSRKKKLILVVLSEVTFVLLLLLVCKCLESDGSVCASDACGAFIRPDNSQILRQL